MEGLFLVNYYVIDLAGDCEPKKKSSNSSVQKEGGILLALAAGWDLEWGASGGSHRARTGKLMPLCKSPADLGRNDGPSPRIPNPILWKFRFLKGYEFCEIHLTVADIRRFPSSPLHWRDFIFLVMKCFRADWTHPDIFRRSFFFLLFFF